MPSFHLRAGSRCEIGHFRDENEDRVHVDARRGLFLVADGVGGAPAGEVASQLAIDTVVAELARRRGGIDRSRKVMTADIRDALRAANQPILDRRSAVPELDGMKTTMALLLVRGGTGSVWPSGCHALGSAWACRRKADGMPPKLNHYLRGNWAFVAHPGDSRAYLIRHGRLRQITKDHLAPHRMVVANGPTAADGFRIVTRAVLSRCLGAGSHRTDPDIKVLRIRSHDRLLLTTDGLTSRLSRTHIIETLNGHARPRPAARMLVARALDRGTRDNVSCVVVRVR